MVQWIGAGAFVASLFLQGSAYHKDAPPGSTPMPNMAGIAFQQIAFTHAFGNSGISQDELDAIRRMMGVEGPLPSEPPLNYPEQETESDLEVHPLVDELPISSESNN